MSDLAETLKSYLTTIKNPIEEVKLKPLERENNFYSKIYKADIYYISNNEDVKNLFVKTNPFEKNSNKINFFQSHFLNEAFFYNEAFPELIARLNSKNLLLNVIPKCHLANGDLIVLDDEMMNGYFNGPKLLDIDHLTLVMRSLALYHAASFVLKFRHPDKFKTLVSKIKETFSPNLESQIYPLRLTAIDAFDRFIKAYPEKAKQYNKTIIKLKKLINDTANFYKWLLRADEPLSVLCHGDFNRNNMRFKYNENGVPIEVKFFDFQTIRHSSPMIDISFLFFMNIEPEIRAANWQDLISQYHGIIHNTICSELLSMNPSDVKLPNFNLFAFLCEYKKRSIYGFTITVHFFRTVFTLGSEFDPKLWNPELTVDYWESYLKMGGIYCDHLSEEMILHILEEGFTIHLFVYPN